MKKLLVALLVIVAAGAGLYFYFHKKHQPVVNEEIAKRLTQLVFDGSQGLYRLEMDSLEANVVDSKLTLFKARLIPDTLMYAKMLAVQKAPQDLFQVSVDQFTLDDISPVDFLAAKKINLQKILIKNPVIVVKHRKQSVETLKGDSTKTVFQRLQDKISSIKVDTIFIQNADFSYNNLTKKKLSHLDQVSFFATDFLLDENTQNDSARFLFAKKCSIRIQDYSLSTPDSLYKLKFDDFIIQTARRELEIINLHYLPAMGVKQFYNRIGHQQDRVDLKIGRVLIQDIDWWLMVGDEAMTVHNLHLDGVKLDIFNDKSRNPDKRSKLGKYPHQALMRVAFGMKIDTVQVANMELAYTEFNPKTRQAGTLKFSNVKATVRNLTNDSVSIHERPLLVMNATGRFMNEAPVSANFVFDLKNQKKGSFVVNARLGALSAAALNRLTVPLGSVKIDDIHVKGLQAQITGDNTQAKGTVTFEYDHLKISVLKNVGDTMTKRKLISFIANRFVIKDQNPDKGKPIRVSPAFYKRDMNKSFFNLVWKTIFSGAKLAVGYK